MSGRAVLDPGDRDTLVLRSLENRTLREVGVELGITTWRWRSSPVAGMRSVFLCRLKNETIHNPRYQRTSADPGGCAVAAAERISGRVRRCGTVFSPSQHTSHFGKVIVHVT